VVCLQRLADASYDLLLLDYSLPDINGLGLLEEVKSRGYRLPVVMVTGQGDERIAVEAMKEGAADYLIKTGGYLTALPAVIQKVLHQAELQQNLALAQAEVLQRNRELTDLHTLASTLSTSLRLADMLPLALEVILASVEAECGGIYLSPPDGEDLIRAVHRGLSAAALELLPERVRVGEGLIGAAAQDGKSISLDDPDRPPLAGLGVSWLVVVPLTAKGRQMGILFVGSAQADGSSPERQRLLELMGNQVGAAVENARLYEETRRAYEDLQQTQGQLIQVEKLRALGEMAGGVAHDFNNLLAIILGRAQYLSLRHGEMTPEEVRRSLGIIERASLDGAETVRRLMNFTRATPRSREAEAVDPNEILDYVADASRPRWKDEVEAKGRQIQVVVERGDVPLVEGNGSELREVMLNLIFNAIEAMPQGGRLTLRSWTEGGSVCLAVQDTGIGMPEEVAQKIFDPFFTTKGPQRSGLGLSVSYGIIRRHHGEIVVESRPGEGTTFTIRLPIRPAPPRTVEEVPAPPRSRLRILIVDDDLEVREMLGDILRNAKHTVIEAGDGKEALEMLEREPVDLVCTDLGMPGMTGWELADRVKQRWPDLKVALITGWGAQVEPEDLEAHGVDLFIAKPFQVREILQALDRIGAGSHTKGQ
jgi:signal transduction histidine kinase/DNA-binding response OmpR family regulator